MVFHLGSPQSADTYKTHRAEISFSTLTEQDIQVKKSPTDVLENIRFEDAYRDKESEILYEVKVEQGKEEEDEYEILSIYSCNECVMHEGSTNKVDVNVNF